MAENKNLTDNFIKSFTKPEKRVEIYDSVVTGMILRVTKTGHKSFAFRYWYDGQSKQRTIGKYGDIGLADARSKAKEWKMMIADGLDPIYQKQANKIEKRFTLKDYIDRFIDDYVNRKLKPSTQATYKSRLRKIRENEISKICIDEITRSDIRHFLKMESKQHPTNANRIHSILSKLFNEAMDDGLISKNPIKGMEKLSKEKSRDPRYSEEDVKKIWEATSTEHPSMRNLLRILLVTGQRLGETSRMKWNDIDINDALWTIPKSETKGGRTHDVPLSNMALNLIQEMRLFDSKYVFPAIQDNNKHLAHFNEVKLRIRKSSGLKEFRIHDLRHIAATGMIETGVDFIHVGKVLNHKELARESAITSRYINTDFKEQKRNALDIWTGKLTEIVSPLYLTVKKTS